MLLSLLLYNKPLTKANTIFKISNKNLPLKVTQYMTEIIFPLKVTEAASTKAYELLIREGREDLRLRVKVSPGGCSGFRYEIFFEEREFEGDIIKEFDNLEVIVDKTSIPYLEGATVDFEDTLAKQGFTIDNPNAGNSCACGDSFS